MKCMNQALRLAAFLGTTAFSAEANPPAVPPASLSSEVPVIVRDVGLEDGLFPLTPALSPQVEHSPQILYSFPQSRRDCVLQPRVASSELPWVNCVGRFQPQRGCDYRASAQAATPLGLTVTRTVSPG